MTRFERELAHRTTHERTRMRLGVALGVLFLVGPLSDLRTSRSRRGSGSGSALGLALFVATYLSLLPPAALARPARRRQPWSARLRCCR